MKRLRSFCKGWLSLHRETGDDGLYKIVINSLGNKSPISLIEEEEMCMTTLTRDLKAKHRDLT